LLKKKDKRGGSKQEKKTIEKKNYEKKKFRREILLIDQATNPLKYSFIPSMKS
jgi:hypothetical protein